MVIPQYSIRWLLGVTAVCAVVFAFFGAAVRGHLWAVGVSVAVGSLAAAMFAYAGLFTLVWLFSLALSLVRGGARPGRSPFRTSPFAVTPPGDLDTPAAPIILDDDLPTLPLLE
jgi:hypothetical protein